MQLLIEEMGLTDTVDPLAGSYYVETLPNEMEEEMVRIMGEIEEKGGIVKMIAEGELQSHVSSQAYQHQRALESGEIRKIGVNCHEVEEEDPQVEMHPYNVKDTEEQVRRLNEIKASRDQSAVSSALTKVKQAAVDGANTMPAIMEAVTAYATVGEIRKELESVYGRFDEPIRF
jgi:methylmalonyl-CoA mutase N-terminal domain/subunit